MASTPITPRTDAPALVSREPPSLDASLVRGIAWTGGTRWLAHIIQWASTLLVARILSPEDYGLVGMAMVYIGLVTLFSEFGIGSAVLTLRDLSRQQIAQLNAVAVYVGFFGFAISCLVAFPLGRFFDAPQLPPVVIAISVAFVVSAFRIVPLALLQRELRFKLISLIQMSQGITAAVCAVALAVSGFGYWTLVLATLVSTLTVTVLAVAVRPYEFARPHFQALRPALRFSSHILGGRLSWFVYSNADLAIAGKMIGQTALGYYSFAASLASAPVDKITEMVHRVTPAVFATIQDDMPQLRRYMLRLTAGIALIAFPGTLGLGLVAADFVPLVLGEHWRGMIAPLRILAFYAAFRSITALPAQVLIVIGESRFAMRTGVLAAAVLPIAFYVGSAWGVVGIAAAWAIVHPIVVMPLFWRVFARIQLSAAQYVRALWPALSGSMLMIMVVLLIGWQLPDDQQPVYALLFKMAAGAATYVAALLLFHRAHVLGFLRTFRLLRD
jgi:teichuronic acid exporter